MADELGVLPPATRLGRVALTVDDIDAMAAFYESVVGLTVQQRTGDHAVLGDGETPLLELRRDGSASERPAAAAGLFHTAFRVPSREALGDALTRIESSWRLSGVADHHVSEALYCADPEGNGVEIYRDRSQSTWERTAEGELRIPTEPLDTDAVRAAGTGDQRAPVGTDVGHIHIEATDLEAASTFYVDALGMDVRATTEGALFLAAGEYHHHVGVNVWNDRSAPHSGRGLDWVELVVPSEDAVGPTRDRLSEAGFDTETATAGVTVTDPDGITFRLRA